MENFKQWAIDQHRSTNHIYDRYLPYEFHLRMVACEVRIHYTTLYNTRIGYLSLIEAAYGHDLIEDARVSYADIVEKQSMSKSVADIIYACTNNKGKNRGERANAEYYRLIRETPGAQFIKFCDRIANVRYGLLTGSPQYEMYAKENQHFIDEVYTPDMEVLRVKNTLISLFK